MARILRFPIALTVWTEALPKSRRGPQTAVEVDFDKRVVRVPTKTLPFVEVLKLARLIKDGWGPWYG